MPLKPKVREGPKVDPETFNDALDRLKHLEGEFASEKVKNNEIMNEIHRAEESMKKLMANKVVNTSANVSKSSIDQQFLVELREKLEKKDELLHQLMDGNNAARHRIAELEQDNRQLLNYVEVVVMKEGSRHKNPDKETEEFKRFEVTAKHRRLQILQDEVAKAVVILQEVRDQLDSEKHNLNKETKNGFRKPGEAVRHQNGKVAKKEENATRPPRPPLIPVCPRPDIRWKPPPPSPPPPSSEWNDPRLQVQEPNMGRTDCKPIIAMAVMARQFNVNAPAWIPPDQRRIHAHVTDTSCAPPTLPVFGPGFYAF